MKKESEKGKKAPSNAAPYSVREPIRLQALGSVARFLRNSAFILINDRDTNDTNFFGNAPDVGGLRNVLRSRQKDA
jgi:hypothetical protein